MYRQERRFLRNAAGTRPGIWTRLRDRLVYIPGALVLLYGFWLTLTA